MRNKKYLGLALVIVLALLLTTVAFAQGVSLRLSGWASSPAEDAALKTMLDAFMKANPDIKVEFTPATGDYPTTMQAAFASGDYAEVFYVDSSVFPSWEKNGVIADGTDKIADQEDIYPSLRNVFTVDGKFYCPPKDFSTLALEYNKDMFDAAGVKYPTADWTWDDLKDAAKKLTGTDKDGNKVLGLVLPADFNRWLPFFFQAGGELFDKDGNFAIDSDAGKAAMDYYLGLVTEGSAGPASAVDSGWGGEALGKGRAAMVMEGNWVIQFMLDNYPKINWGVAEMPAHPGDKNKASMAYTVCYGVAQDNKHPDESWKLVNFLTGKEGAQMVATSGFGVMPSRASAADAWSKTWTDKLTTMKMTDLAGQLSAFTKGAEYAHGWQLPAGFGPVNDAFNSSLQEAYAGNKLSEDVLKDTASAAADVMKKSS
jgi:multiple sugar transport system substrate-binding protein